jgi:hypothetical protein
MKGANMRANPEIAPAKGEWCVLYELNAPTRRSNASLVLIGSPVSAG